MDVDTAAEYFKNNLLDIWLTAIDLIIFLCKSSHLYSQSVYRDGINEFL